MNVEHKNLADGKWSTMPLVNQLAHVGSEVHRALSWQAKDNRDYCLKAASRALELLDLTLDTAKFPQLKEIARLRESIVDYFWATNQFKSTKTSFEKYFLGFNYAARKNL